MKKKLFGFNTKTLVGTALGAALFTVLFMYVKIPTGIPETQIQSAYGIGGFFAAMFGPIAGLLIAPKLAKKIEKPAQWISIALFMGMIIVSFSQNWRLFVENLFYIVIIVLVHNGLALGTGYLGATLGKVGQRDRRSLTIETGIQNSGLGLILLFNTSIFPAEIWHGHYGGMLFITAWWGIWHIVSGLTVAYLFRRTPLNA